MDFRGKPKVASDRFVVKADMSGRVQGVSGQVSEGLKAVRICCGYALPARGTAQPISA